MPLLQVHDLHVDFATGGGTIKAVSGVGFEVGHGEVVGVVGESGSGKSVSALAVVRLLAEPPAHVYGGPILFDGQDVLGMDGDQLRALRGRGISMIFQDPMTSLNPVFTIGRQIVEPLELHLGLRGRAAHHRTVELLEMVGIPSAASRFNDYPHQFSGGMRQRVMIAMALSCEPKLLIADEPTTALDVTIQAQILELLRRVTSDMGTSLILVTHDMGVIAGITERVYVMYSGRVVETATTDEIFRDPKMPYTWGLLRSMPRIDEERRERLVTIEGLPPDPLAPLSGCRFYPRCPHRRAPCESTEPDLEHVPNDSPHHSSRCWATQQGGWLETADWRKEHGAPEVIQEIRRSFARTSEGRDD